MGKFPSYVIQTTEGRKNLVYIYFMLPRFFANALNDKMLGSYVCPQFGQTVYASNCVIQIQNGAAMTNSRILKANEEVPVRS